MGTANANAILVLLIIILIAQFALVYIGIHLPLGQNNLLADVVIALLVTDLGSALFHWFEDAYLDYNIHIPGLPLVSAIAKENDMHHYRPRMIVYETYAANMRGTTVVSIVYAALVLWIDHVRKIETPMRRLILVLAFSCVANLIHRYSHEKDCERPRIVTWLQSWLLVSREEHRVHHSTEQHKRFGVFLKHANCVYDSIGIWRGLEHVLKLFGIHPNHKSFYIPDYDDDVILSDEWNCQQHSEHELQEWKNNLQQMHDLRRHSD
jgi:hypothetical protein